MLTLAEIRALDPASDSGWTDANISVIDEGLVQEDPNHVPLGLEGKTGVVLGTLLFMTETGKTGSVHGELKTNRFANLAELQPMAGIHPDPVSAFSMRCQKGTTPRRTSTRAS